MSEHSRMGAGLRAVSEPEAVRKACNREEGMPGWSSRVEAGVRGGATQAGRSSLVQACRNPSGMKREDSPAKRAELYLG